MNKENIYEPVNNSGFVYEEPKPQDWVLGASPLENRIIFPDGHGWANYRPEPEMQRNIHFDTFSCVTFATLKALVMYLRVNYGLDFNLSEMFTAVMSNTKPNVGNTVRNVLESVRKDGFIEEHLYPFTANTTQNQFFNPVPAKLVEMGKKKLLKWQINWEVLDVSSNVSRALIREALQYSPVIASGFAWIGSSTNKMYYDEGRRPNHCFLIDEYDREHPDRLIANDSYSHNFSLNHGDKVEEFLKVLHPSYRIWSAHKITAFPIIKPKESLLTKYINMFKEVIRDVHGGYWFIKDGKRQKLNSVWGLMTVIFRKDGVAKDNVSDEELRRFQETNEFFK